MRNEQKILSWKISREEKDNLEARHRQEAINMDFREIWCE
jgi:hypothetical protein